MNSDEKIAIEKSREYIVSKSNQIVQKSRYDFTLAEQRTIAFICSKIKPIEALDRAKGTPFQLEYEFNILDYVRTCGLQDNGKLYEEVKATLKNLSDKSMWLQQEDGSEVLVRWLAKVRTNKRSGIAKIKIDEDLAPYLFDLKEKFLSYGLKNILNMKSQYSIRLYELLKSYYDMKVGQTDRRKPSEKSYKPKKISWTVELEEFKKLLMVDTVKSYARYPSFRQKVLDVAQKEINELTDINVYFEQITKGRKVIKLKIDIVAKLPMEKMLTSCHNDELLGAYKLSAEEQTEKMQLVMQEVQKISTYTGVSEEAAYDLFLNGYDVPSELDGQKIAFSESELTPDLLTNLAENNVRSVKVMSDESIVAGYMNYLHKQKKDNKF